ncbi:phosphonate C-P lyase system protein PhnH [Vibrio sp.]|jgi:alpha-D-ribose 1-methylphosphonate 5-triphosphate synthase subunit PhnH|uniref:phosphonate C-P lyase system protein PhnH n=1 Tax=Vibrio sp. TaxID=678 RepID=UPI00311E7799
MLQVDSLWLPQLQQRNYRHLLNAMSRPGTQNEILHGVPDQYKPTYGFLPLLATLTDSQVSISDPEFLLKESDWKMLQASNTEVIKANFIVATGERAIDEGPKLGSLANPEDSATLIICVSKIGEGDQALQLTGPGVNGSAKVQICGLSESWLERRSEWCSSFPIGVDILLCDRDSFIALPRTTRVEVI